MRLRYLNLSLGRGAAALLLAAATSAQAFTYQNADLLLVMRKSGFNDALFNLGSVSNYLNLAPGTSFPVTGWSVTAAKANFNNNLNGALFVLMAVSPRLTPSTLNRTWITCEDAGVTPTEIGPTAQGVQYGKISGVGVKAAETTSFAPTNYYSVSPQTDTAYTYIVSDAVGDPANHNGAVAFVVEKAIPGNMRFFEIKVQSTNPKTNSLQIGSFSMATDGTLSFTSGSSGTPPSVVTPPQAQSVPVNSNVTFTVSAGGTAPLTYQWRFNSTNLTGQTGTSLTLNNVQTNHAGGYSVVVSNSFGSVTSAVAQLRVLLPPTVGGGTTPPNYARQPGQFSFQIGTVNGLQYTLEYKTNLATAGWISIPPTVGGTGGAITLTDPGATNSFRSYRIRVQ